MMYIYIRVKDDDDNNNDDSGDGNDNDGDNQFPTCYSLALVSKVWSHTQNVSDYFNEKFISECNIHSEIES